MKSNRRILRAIGSVLWLCSLSAFGSVPRFAYVANDTDNSVSMYTVDAATGQLRHNGYVVAGTFPMSVTVDPSGRFAYVANYGSNNVSAYRVNPATGTLAAVTKPLPSPFAAGTHPFSVAVDPSGRFAYVVNAGSNDVSAYRIQSVTGALTAIAGSPFAAGSFPVSLRVDPTGKFAYVANAHSGNVSAYRIDATTGALAEIAGSPFPAGAIPSAVAVDPSGTFAYVANHASYDVSAYRVDAASGALTEITGSPFPAGATPSAVVVDPSGVFVYVANHGSQEVSAYRINPTTGTLLSLGTVRAQTGAISLAMTQGETPVSYTPRFVYVANAGSNDVSAYRIDATTGALTEVTGSPFATGAYPWSVAVDPSGKFAYVANFHSKSVSAYRIDATTGALTEITGSPFAVESYPGTLLIPGSSHPFRVMIEPSGRFLYVADGDTKHVFGYRINATTGALTQVSGSPFPAGFVTDPTWGTSILCARIDPTGQFLYLGGRLGFFGEITAHRIDAATGGLTRIGGSPYYTTRQAADLGFHPSGKFAYSSGVEGLRIDATFGALTYIAGSPLAAGSYVAVDPSGRFAYVPNSGNILAYRIDDATGAWTEISGSPFALGESPWIVGIDPSGRFAYALNHEVAYPYSSFNNISTYRIDATTGALSAVGTVATGTNPVSIAVTGAIQ